MVLSPAEISKQVREHRELMFNLGLFKPEFGLSRDHLNFANKLKSSFISKTVLPSKLRWRKRSITKKAVKLINEEQR
ncbi:MAG: hypothetical protein GOV15_00005, partial [Candidatus Diapherotrites archaeon]|nr:hypothetical protein [Candidatus Diapherotrites archaeon]